MKTITEAELRKEMVTPSELRAWQIVGAIERNRRSVADVRAAADQITALAERIKVERITLQQRC